MPSGLRATIKITACNAGRTTEENAPITPAGLQSPL
jgi:hypothetical protein